MRDFSRQTFLYILFQSNLMVRIQSQKGIARITKKKSLPQQTDLSFYPKASPILSDSE